MDPVLTLNLDALTVESFAVAPSVEHHDTAIVETGCVDPCEGGDTMLCW